MTTDTKALDLCWQGLLKQAARVRPHLRTLFAEDKDRARRFAREQLFATHRLCLDFSKQRLTAEDWSMLMALPQAAAWTQWRRRMQEGDPINHTEQRAVSHMQCRAGNAAPPETQQTLARMFDFCNEVHQGRARGYSKYLFTDVVSIGIGGSDLGPRMAARALHAFRHRPLQVHFVANVDGADLMPHLETLNPATTLFVVASKTFTTTETLANARSARAWLMQAARPANAQEEQSVAAAHFAAASTNIAATSAFGLDPARVFPFSEAVGGRFSTWSSVGLALLLAIGVDHFQQFLAGGQAMDEHFLNAPDEDNLPLILALLESWNGLLGATTHAMLPYSQSLAEFPAHLQQLEMESLGKSVNRQGRPVARSVCPVIWGEPGTNGQHSFYQWLHQSGVLTPCDFIAFAAADYPLADQHRTLLANVLAQAAALAFGLTAEEARAQGVDEHTLPYRIYEGNQPSTLLLLDQLTPFTLGLLLALYEHKVFAQGALHNINAFDQWGVELGKVLAKRLEPLLLGAADQSVDESTRRAISFLRRDH